MPSKKTPEQWEAVTLRSEKPLLACFLNVVEPSAATTDMGRKAKPVFSATFILDPADPFLVGKEKSIHQRVLHVAKEEFPTQWNDALKAAKASGGLHAKNVLTQLSANLSLPFETGEHYNETKRVKKGKQPYDFMNGKIVFKASSGADKDDNGNYKYQPKLGSVESGRGVLFDKGDLAVNGEKFFNGALVFAKVQFAPWMVDGKQGIKAYLQSVMVTGKGTKIGGGGGAEEFDKFLGNVSDEDPMDEPLAA